MHTVSGVIWNTIGLQGCLLREPTQPTVPRSPICLRPAKCHLPTVRRLVRTDTWALRTMSEDTAVSDHKELDGLLRRSIFPSYSTPLLVT